MCGACYVVERRNDRKEDRSMKKPTGPTGTAIREAARLQRRVDELQETLEIVAAKSERHRLECEFWRDEFLKRIKEESNAKTV
jgi:hypothetical protein